MTEAILELVKNVPVELRVIILAALPIVELRGAIPLALLFGLEPLEAFTLSVIGNLLPVLPILIFLNPAVKLLGKIPVFERFFDWLFTRTRKKDAEVRKYGIFGLILFVGVPLPVTGAWTGSLLAFLFGFSVLKSFLAIAVGVLIAGILVTLASLGVLQLFSAGTAPYLILLVILGIVIWWAIKRRRDNV